LGGKPMGVGRVKGEVIVCEYDLSTLYACMEIHNMQLMCAPVLLWVTAGPPDFLLLITNFNIFIKILSIVVYVYKWCCSLKVAIVNFWY
jgi:hypothetical protein